MPLKGRHPLAKYPQGWNAHQLAGAASQTVIKPDGIEPAEPSDQIGTHSQGWIESPKIIGIGCDGWLTGSARADDNVSIHHI